MCQLSQRTSKIGKAIHTLGETSKYVNVYNTTMKSLQEHIRKIFINHELSFVGRIKKEC